jgi:tRNA pseudouridine13 synthase
MKLKVRNEDFKVEEFSAMDVQQSGEYAVYILRKSGWNTVDALVRAARQLGVPYSVFSFGGRKDRHASTLQMVTARSTRDLTVEGEGYSLEIAGRSQRPMGPDLIKANSFEIMLRSLSDNEVETMTRREPQVRSWGFANFFDDQRFGSIDKTRGFVAERILKGQWKGALELYLTAEYLDASSAQQHRRNLYAENWGNWQLLAEKAPAEHEAVMMAHLMSTPRDYLGALQRIPRDDLSMLFAAYQGLLWNEVLRRYLRRHVSWLGEYPGDAGPYLFFGSLSDEILRKLHSQELPTTASKMAFSDPDVEVLYDSVLLERGLHRGSFNLRRLRQSYFRSSGRQVVVLPARFKIEEAMADELYDGRLKMLVRFELPRGSYGTMAVKALLTEVPQ